MSATLLLLGCQQGDDGGNADDIFGGDWGETPGETVGGDGDGDGNGDGDGDGNGDGDGDGNGDGDGETGDPMGCDVPSPYMGGWDIGCCQNEVAPQNGWYPGNIHVGTILPDWTFTDQFGEAVRLYDFCHDAIWFEYVALW